jgi:hypothetical protein
MNSFPKTRRAATVAATLTLLAAGLLSASTAMARSTPFDDKMTTVVAHVKADPNYKSVPLDTSSDRQWFFYKCEALFDKQISKDQFIAEGSKQFPGYEASFKELADELTAP